jgi:hypothetical protein
MIDQLRLMIKDIYILELIYELDGDILCEELFEVLYSFGLLFCKLSLRDFCSCDNRSCLTYRSSG